MMATRPATAPEAAPSVVALPSRIRSTRSQAEHRGAGGDLGVDEGDAGDAVGGERGAGVEAEPAEPQQAGAEHRRTAGCAGASRSFGQPDALAEDERQREAGGTGVDVHRGAAGEVDREQRWRSSRPRR